MFLNTCLALIKITAGILGQSYALVADGVESTADIASSMIVWSGLRVATVPADENHPFGHGKAESLAAVASSLALFTAAAFIGVESVREIVTPHHAPRWYTLVVLALVVVAKGAMSRYVAHAGQDLDSTALKSDAMHHASDAITSLAAFIGISIALIGGPGYESADDWGALVACAIIFYNGCRLMIAAVNDVMEIAPDPELIEKVRVVARGVEGVLDVEKCRLRKSGLAYLVDIHVVVDSHLSVQQGHLIGHEVKDALLASEHRIADATVHIEPHEMAVIPQ